MIDLYAAGTSNGMRARIGLEECGLAYNFHPIDLAKGEQKSPSFLAMNPNGQIPVIVDSDGPGGKPVTLSQSVAVLMSGLSSLAFEVAPPKTCVCAVPLPCGGSAVAAGAALSRA